jgi:membrane-bound inhibitor of C-type lysozyme
MVVLALSLAGCRDRAGIPPAGAQAPVNPDARVTSYACADGQTIVAGYPDPDTAVVTYKDHAYTLKRIASPHGARYTGYGIQWQTNGAHASIIALKPGEAAATGTGLDCEAAPGQPAARISFARPGSRLRRGGA